MAITGGIGTRAISKKYPATSGLEAETTKTAGRKTNLIPIKGSLVRRALKVGL